MAESVLPIAWLSADGVVHGAYGASKALRLQPSQRICQAVHHGDVVVCRTDGGGVTAYSIRTGEEVCPKPLPDGWIVDIGGGVVWLQDSITYALQGVDLLTGDIVATLQLAEDDRCAIVTHGALKGHVLVYGQDTLRLIEPLTGRIVWQHDAPQRATPLSLLIARGDWFCCHHDYFLTDNNYLEFRSLVDGSPVDAVTQRPEGRPPSCELTHPIAPTYVRPWPMTVLAMWSPERMLAIDANVFTGNWGLVHIDGSYDSRFVSPCPHSATNMFVVSPHTMAEVIVASGSAILVADSRTAAILDTRPAPGIVTAWHWPPADHARREHDCVLAAIGAVDASLDASLDDAVDASRDDGVGLVRAVLVGFIAEDTRLTILCCEEL